MLEFKHPTMTGSLSVFDFFRASTKPRASLDSERSPIGSSKSPSKSARTKGIEAACVLPTIIFLGTEMFTPAGKEPKPAIDVPKIIVTADEDDEQTSELPAS